MNRCRYFRNKNSKNALVNSLDPSDWYDLKDAFEEEVDENES